MRATFSIFTVTVLVQESSTMALSDYLPPGLAYLSRAILSGVILCTALWVIQYVFGLKLLLWH